MPKVSKESAAHVDEYGIAEDRHEEIDGFAVSFVSIREEMDLAPMLKGLPGLRLQGPPDVAHRRSRGGLPGGRRVLRPAGPCAEGRSR